MPALVDLTGQRFGRLAVLKRSGTSRYGKAIWECLCNCGNNTHVVGQSLTLGYTRSCGCLQKEIASNNGVDRVGPLNTNWKGGSYRTKKGYIRVLDASHPNAHCNGYVLEHIKVMSEHLGRPLRPGENVHHINGVKDDNRIKNLELWSSSQPPGQRVTDQVAWAEQILQQYAPHKLKGD